VVEFDLRASSMLHGKKLFGRLEWACKNVLNHSLTWLFYNFNPSSAESLPADNEPISIHHPTIHAITPVATKLPSVLVPKMTVADLPNIYTEDASLALLEYLHLLSLDSPRIQKHDRMDSFLSRYEVPDLGQGLVTEDMVRVRWKGFIPPRFVREVYLMIRKEGLKVAREEQDGEGGTDSQGEARWVGLTGKSFEGFGGGWSVVQFAGRETLSWAFE
jgi:ribonuclease P/MRP protein subunit RPP40